MKPLCMIVYNTEVWHVLAILLASVLECLECLGLSSQLTERIVRATKFSHQVIVVRFVQTELEPFVVLFERLLFCELWLSKH